MNKQQVKWDESFKSGRDYSPMNVILLDLILAEMTHEQKTAIDLGCGTGDAVIKLAQRGMTVTGLDWSPDALEKVRIRADNAQINNRVTLKEADLNDLTSIEISKDKADLVLCKLVVAFIEDKKRFCTIAQSLLSDTGMFVIQTPVLHEAMQYTSEDKPEIAVKYKEFASLLHEIFESVVIFNHSYYGDKGDLVTFIVK